MPHSEPWEDANLVICEISKQTDAVKTAVFRILQFLDSYKAKKVFFFFLKQAIKWNKLLSILEK